MLPYVPLSRLVPVALFLSILLNAWQKASATEVDVSAKALERTLRAQLFTGADGRYYMKGSPTSACYVYALDPRVSFRDDRIVVQVKTKARLGTALHGNCLGLGLSGSILCARC